VVTATAAEAPFRQERREDENEAGVKPVLAPDLPTARERSTFTLISVVLAAEIAWLGIIVYGLFLLAR
jgi:hypothetical protein